MTNKDVARELVALAGKLVEGGEGDQEVRGLTKQEISIAGAAISDLQQLLKNHESMTKDELANAVEEVSDALNNIMRFIYGGEPPQM